MNYNFSDSEKKWKEDVKNSSQRNYSFKSASGEDVDPLYYPEDNENNYLDKLNFPGQFPYTRGIHPNLYRGNLQDSVHPLKQTNDLSISWNKVKPDYQLLLICPH